MTEENNKSNRRLISKTVFFILVLTVLFIIAFVVLKPFGTERHNTPQDLDLGVRTSSEGVYIVNKEKSELINCEVRLNNEYTRRLPRIASKEILLPYSTLAKGDGERFNVLTHKVKSVLIENCNDQPGRMGIYGN